MKENNWNTEVKKNTINLAIWTGLWTASLALASFGPLSIWKDNTSLTIIAVLINAGFGIGMIFANVRHINSMDDLQKKIQLDAMGISLGVGVVGGLSYSLLDTTNLIAGDAEISFLVVLIGITYMIGLLIGQNRYK